MIKNLAGQVLLSPTLYTSADTTVVFAGTVTVYVTVDNGTQTIGSVGSGICTSKGNGKYTYLPSAAETNGNIIDFTFTGTGMVTSSQSVVTSLQTGDSYARLGAPTGASISADIHAMLTTALTESYAADGAPATATQILYGIQQFLMDMAVSGVGITVYKLDGVTTALTLTTNSVPLPSTVATTIHRTG